MRTNINKIEQGGADGFVISLGDRMTLNKVGW